jgi:hypothetical protein
MHQRSRFRRARLLPAAIETDGPVEHQALDGAVVMR